MRTKTALRLLAAAVTGILIVGCSDASTADESIRTDDGEIVESGEVGAFRLQVGDCVNGAMSGEVSSVDGVPCDEEHQFEVYYAFDILGSDFPGAEAVQEEAQTTCLEQFEPFVGATYAESIYDITALWPTEESWDMVGDREVLCMILNYDGTNKTGSAKGTAV